MVDVGISTLRLMVHRVPELRTKAMEIPRVNAEWVKPIQGTQGTSGIMSFRSKFGFSTTRRAKAAKSPE